jgi:hypothetical protein
MRRVIISGTTEIKGTACGETTGCLCKTSTPYMPNFSLSPLTLCQVLSD